MLTKRIIPCLDIKNGRTVKGVNFIGLRDAGDPIELARRYTNEGADELVFLDITATKEKRKTLVNLVREIAREINIPFTVGGGIRSVDEIEEILKAGADKVSLNSSIVKNPELLTEASSAFGSQAIVAAVDAKRSGHSATTLSNTNEHSESQHLLNAENSTQRDSPNSFSSDILKGTWEVYVKGGSEATGIDAITWMKEVERLGSGEILLTSMDRDGTKSGFDLELLKIVNQTVTIPVIASGGAGTIEHCCDSVLQGNADAVLAASIFHFREIEISELKKEMANQGISVRIINESII